LEVSAAVALETESASFDIVHPGGIHIIRRAPEILASNRAPRTILQLAQYRSGGRAALQQVRECQ
jgi:hypothetical protein